MSTNFKIVETESFQKNINKVKYKNIFFKIRNYVYPQLRENPFFGPNIKKFKFTNRNFSVDWGKLSKYYRYRIGSHQLFYTIDSNNTIVFIVAIKDRKDSY